MHDNGHKMCIRDRNNTFVEEVKAIPGGEFVELCYSCGTCVSKCMIQEKIEPEYNPRRLLRMVVMEMRDDACESPTTWLCSSCDLCYPCLLYTSRCV